ncbi:oxidoreductase NAD-binding domain-containing protein 1 isoform X1 [Stegostoma tigrinum]|uniref:oxidoreductase NAD-binding domain-containing protein 1 isoform X1 n=1 Tax=Stegostoma tigrinum TaxID=3053191 RepID=UPI00202B0658|nr:oxidoreductase NAD-binding domain-containing protein 1 isoform X1 [Stegostoma tigrinum]
MALTVPVPVARAVLRFVFRGAAVGPIACFPSRWLSGPWSHCHSRSVRAMSSRRKIGHLERTVNNFRQEMIAEAKVCGIVQESETVKRLRLVIMNKDFAFKAGQWVDFFIPGISQVGGFSICSSPGLLERESVLELAVKYSEHLPAHWIHTQNLLVAGKASIYYPLQRPSRSNHALLNYCRPGGTKQASCLVLDGVELLQYFWSYIHPGGVGINPLYSILLHVADLHRMQGNKPYKYKPGSVQLYYSAKNTDELLFKRSIINLAKEFSGKMNCNFHVTQQSFEISRNMQPYVTAGRISERTLAHVSKDNLCYICGPPPMIEAVSQQLENHGVPKESIIFEKWW